MKIKITSVKKISTEFSIIFSQVLNVQLVRTLIYIQSIRVFLNSLLSNMISYNKKTLENLKFTHTFHNLKKMKNHKEVSLKFIQILQNLQLKMIYLINHQLHPIFVKNTREKQNYIVQMIHKMFVQYVHYLELISFIMLNKLM